MRVIRQGVGLTQLQVAQLLGFANSNAVCAWEREHAMPSAPNLIRLCLIYGRGVRELYPEYLDELHAELEKRAWDA